MNKALVIIDIQKDISKNWSETINNINKAVDCAAAKGFHIIYTKHENLSSGSRLLLPGSPGSELAASLKVVSKTSLQRTK
jgi:nicotinamidase-related amidase